VITGCASGSTFRRFTIRAPSAIESATSSEKPISISNRLSSTPDDEFAVSILAAAPTNWASSWT
jgi:hypothetical protein